MAKHSAMTLTRSTAYAAGRDAGYRSMRKAGRTKWNEEDFNAAAEMCNRLLDMLNDPLPASPPWPCKAKRKRMERINKAAL